MDALARLIAAEEIKELVARRCRTLDAQDWEGYARCHTADIVSHAIGTELGKGEPVVGIDAVLAVLREQLAGRTTVHQVHSPEIRVAADRTAAGVWAMEDRLWWEHEGRSHWLHGFGHYYEQYVVEDGRWLVASRRLVRIRVDSGTR